MIVQLLFKCASGTVVEVMRTHDHVVKLFESCSMGMGFSGVG